LYSLTTGVAHARSLLLEPNAPWRYPTSENAAPVVDAFGRSLVTAVPGTELKLTQTTGGSWSAVFRMTSVWRGYQDPAGMDIQMDLRTGLISAIRFEGAFPHVAGVAQGQLLSEEEMAASSALELIREHYGPVLRTGVGKALGILRNPETGTLEYWPVHQFVYEELTEDGRGLKPGGKWWFGTVNGFTGETRVTLTEGRPGGPQASREIPALDPDAENATLIALGKRFKTVPIEPPAEFHHTEIGWFSLGDRLLPLQIDEAARLARLDLGDEKRYFRLD